MMMVSPVRLHMRDSRMTVSADIACVALAIIFEAKENDTHPAISKTHALKVRGCLYPAVARKVALAT